MRALSLSLPRFSAPGAPAIVATVGLVAAPLIAWSIVDSQWRTLVLLAVAGFSPVALRWPTLALGMYVFLVPFDSVGIIADTGGATITRLFGIVASGALLAASIIQRRLVRPPMIAWFVLTLFLWGLMTFAWAIDMRRSYAMLMTATSLVAMYFAAISFDMSEREFRTVYFFAMVGGLIAAAAILMFGFESGAGAGVRGTLIVADRAANANAAAHSMILPFAMAIATLVEARNVFAKVLAIASLAVISGGIFLTVSRSSVAAVALMICVLLYRFGVRWQVLMVFGTLGIVIPLMPNVFLERIGMLFTGEDATGSGRTKIWDVGLGALERFGAFGAGFANFPAAYDIYAHTPPGKAARGAHNEFLGTWIELGVVGIVLFVIALVVHLRLAAIRGKDKSLSALSAGIEAACFGFFLIALFSDVLWRKAFWMPWMFAIWSARLHRRVGNGARTSDFA